MHTLHPLTFRCGVWNIFDQKEKNNGPDKNITHKFNLKEILDQENGLKVTAYPLLNGNVWVWAKLG